MGTVIDTEGARRADLAVIHIAKAELGWDDGMYRDILYTVCRVKSAAKLDFSGRKVFLAHLRSCAAAERRTDAGERPAWSTQQRLVWSLWQQLADAKRVERRQMPALCAWLKRQTGVDRLDWLKGKQLQFAVESLKQWLERGAAASTLTPALSREREREDGESKERG